MLKVIYPITWLAGREGETADVIHDIAVEMMEHRADLLRNATLIPEGECQIYAKQASLLEEYATVLDAIYFQLEPDRWNPETSEEVLKLAQVHNITLPDWMKPGKTQGIEKETTEDAVGRFDNEGGRMSHKLLFNHRR